MPNSTPPPSTPSVRMCRIAAPATKNMVPAIIVIAMPVPRSGSAISRKPRKPTISENGTSPRVTCRMASPRLASQAAT